MDRRRKRWTAKEVMEMRQLIIDGSTLREAAHELGRTVKGVQHQCHIRSITLSPGRRPDTDKRSMMVTILGDGKTTIKCAADALGVKPRAARAMVADLVKLDLLRRIRSPKRGVSSLYIEVGRGAYD